RTGSPGARPEWYGERPRGPCTSRGPHAARCPAPHSLHRVAVPAREECRAAAGTLPRDCRARRPGMPRAVGQGRAALGQTQAVLGERRIAAWLLPPAAWKAEVAAGFDVGRAVGELEASRSPPGAAAPHATASAPCPYSPRPHRQSTRT